MIAKDIKNYGKTLLIKVTNPTKKKVRSFTIHGPFYKIVKKYQALRPTKTTNPLFFLDYQNSETTVKHIDLNKFAAMPKEIAKFLRLPDADSYISATFLIDSKEADKATLKQQCRRRPEGLAESSGKESSDKETTISAKESPLKPNAKESCLERPSASCEYDNSVLVPSTTIKVENDEIDWCCADFLGD